MKVTIVTPSFNQGRFLERTIQSVLAQDYGALQHVVQDGGSTDETVEVLTRYAGRLEFVSAADRGQTHAVNMAIARTDGDVIGWLNSDDVYYPGAVATVVRHFSDHPEVDVVYGLADHIDSNDQVIEPYPTEPWNFERLKETCFICQPALFMRRSVVERHGILDETLNYCMDYEYWLRLGQAGVAFAYLEAKFAGSRLHAETKTLGARVKVHREINDMFVRQFGVVPDSWLSNYAHAVVESRVDRVRNPTRFVVELSFRTLLAALRWNRAISPAQQSTVASWIRSA